MDLLEKIKMTAKSNLMRIVLPEAEEERTLRAANQIIEEGLASLVLIGDKQTIADRAEEWKLPNISQAAIVDPNNNPKREEYIQLMLQVRAEKGLTYQQAEKMIVNPLILGAVMIKYGDADGEVAGAINATGDVLRPAFQFVKTRPGVSVVSGAFLMLGPKLFGEDGVLVFADCAVNPNPSASELAEIAIESGRTARNIAGFEPRIAMLSFSTKGSAKHEVVDKVVEATRLAKEKAPDLQIDGELQADAAIVPGVGSLKAPGSTIAGRANVLVFPNLEAGNISYKLVQRFSGAQAIGPVLQGIAAPINDLSRGCSVSDIVNLVAITACQAQDKE